MRVIIYPRVSSKKQVEEGDSIDSQIRRLKEFCEERGYEIIDTYTDAGKSASISDDKISIDIKNGKFIVSIDLNKRPAFKRILEESANKKFEGIVFFRWDRFSRNNIFSKIAQIHFQRHNISLIPSDDVIDPLMVEIKGALSEEEIRKMKERVRLTRLNQFDKGMMVGRCPFGYRFIYKNKREKKGVIGIKIDEKKAEIVRDIFKLTSERIGYKEICEKYKLKPQSYYNIIRNSVYTGIVEFEGKKKKGVHIPIISEELFNKINRR